MAANGNGRSSLSWVILVVALAVPGVLFYNWWSHLKADRERTVAAKARGRVPDGGVFQSSPNAKLVNPMTPEVSSGAVTSAPAAVSTGAALAPVAAQPIAAPQALAQAVAVQPAVAEAAPAQPVPVAVASPASTSAPQGVPSITFSSATAAAVPLKRDPTLSPYDQLRIVEEQEAKDKAARDLEDMKRARVEGKRPKKLKDPASTIELQGIISNADTGYKAIVNNEVVGVGELVGNTKIKIIKISDSGVTFEYMGKRFKKGVSQ